MPSAGMPSAPFGISGLRFTCAPPSVEPYPSITVQPKRVPNFSMSRSAASLPNAITIGLSASSGCSGVARMYERGLPT